MSADYLEAFLRSPLGRHLLKAGVFGGVIDEITPEYIADLMVPVPKDPSVLNAVVEAQARANEGRQQAASGIDNSLSLLDEYFGRELAA